MPTLIGYRGESIETTYMVVLTAQCWRSWICRVLCYARDTPGIGSFQLVWTDPQGRLMQNATITLSRHVDNSRREKRTDQQGEFSFVGLDVSEYQLTAESSGFAAITNRILLSSDKPKDVDLQFAGISSRSESVTVTSDVSDIGAFMPDPAQRVMVYDARNRLTVEGSLGRWIYFRPNPRVSRCCYPSF